MATIDVLKVTGGKAGSIELDDGIFGIEPNVPVMHQVVNAQLAAKRAELIAQKPELKLEEAAQSLGNKKELDVQE